MTLDDRADPAQIIARVGNFADRERALEVWMYLATKAGWTVTAAPDAVLDADAGDCGVIEMEGLRYRVRLTPRVRTTLVDDAGGRMSLITASADRLVLDGLRRRWRGIRAWLAGSVGTGAV